MMNETYNIKGINGEVTDVSYEKNAETAINLLKDTIFPNDIDLINMAEWAMNYLIRTPKKQYDYEPVFQCHPLRCPPVPEKRDVVVACDTDARMEWEWYYMRDIIKTDEGIEVEKRFHQRMLKYIDENGIVWSHPGCYNEGDISAKYSKSDTIIHNWGATKILKALSEDYNRNKRNETLILAKKVMSALKKFATWTDDGMCWFKAGMGAIKADGTVIDNTWNIQPLPIVEALVTYWLSSRDEEGLAFAIAAAEGIINNRQPNAIRFNSDGSVDRGYEHFDFAPHSHTTMHTVWGIADLGIVIGEKKYIDFAKKVFDWMMTRGTGTGWFPAGPDNCNETCCLSDMISIACILGEAGYNEYFDYAERFFRNYINNLQFIIDDAFKHYYYELHKDKELEIINKGLKELEKFQGAIIGGSGLNDFENLLLGGKGGFELYGCCAPEGMRAIHTIWSYTIKKMPKSVLGDKGIYINMCFNRESEWGRVVSFMNEQGRMTVKSFIDGDFFIRVPSWVDISDVNSFINTKHYNADRSGRYLKFSAKKGDELSMTWPLIKFTQKVNGLWKSSAPDLNIVFEWLGNMVVKSHPEAEFTKLFIGKPRVFPNLSK